MINNYKVQHYSDRELELKSARCRLNLLRYIKMANAGHTGGDLSCLDILNVLYNDVLNVSPLTFNDPGRDRYIQSKGHSVEALYVILAESGFFPWSDLETIGQCGSPYVGHPTRQVKGIEFNTGALGHGLPVSAGIALAAKKDGASYRVFTLLGDGELAEGSNWEAAMFSAHYKLDNLVAILDHNLLQISGCCEDICSPFPIDRKFEAFGWKVVYVDGHSIPELRQVLNGIPDETGKPTLVIARTVKGKGVSFMENVLKWHHGVPDNIQYELAVRELEERIQELKGEIHLT